MIYFKCMLFLMVTNISGISGLNNSCKTNTDCATENSICKNGTCACDKISYLNNNNQCLTYATEYRAYCQEDKQCTLWLGPHSKCINNYCICKKSYKWYKGKCRKYVDKAGDCQSNDYCYNGYDLLSLTCGDDGKCSCRDGYYDRGPDCRWRASQNDSTCALDLDCSTLILSKHCNIGTCSLSVPSVLPPSHQSKAMAVGFDFKKNISTTEGNITCEYDDDCKDMANSFCDLASQSCKCAEATHFLHEGNCLPGFSSCETDVDCSVGNSMCFQKTTCICNKGFFRRDGKCVAELGMPDATLTNVNDCLIKPAKFVDSACYCKNFWFNDDSNRNCIKTMIQHVGTCISNEWCNAMGPYSFCNSTTNTCECSSFAVLNETNYYCDKKPDSEVNCLIDTDCKINERCLDEECQCEQDSSRDEETKLCLPNIGGSCVLTKCSHIPNAACSEGVCKCHDNYLGKLNRCLEVANNLNDSCEWDEQCRNFQNAECGAQTENTTRTCVCKAQYMAIGDTCYELKNYGDRCMKESDCTLVLNDSFKCRNSICQCPVTFKLEDGYCVSSSRRLVVGSYILIFSIVTLFSFRLVI